MTLTTTLETFDADPEAIYIAARDAIGIPQHHPFTTSPGFTPGRIYFSHVEGGFNARPDMEVRPDPASSPEPWADDEDEEPDSGWTVKLSIDTTYRGPWSQPEHYDVLAKVIERCGITRYRVNNEFTGEWFTCIDAARRSVK